ncbi:hypothetical protein [Nonomuraea zeae]|uniref:Carboxypeptidase regulatory-like domain-containing protein n=1 Tax=Nonomuraea zeae TaxID=1642303 RepID=A0A5S4GRA5_9ACTN|nr:hypothetical protein [Nonomuraea zeae]TMR35495.1 hypothetical protein ETD85_13825 [Nonomuraea zeae]
MNEDTPYPAPSLGVTLSARAPRHWARLSGQVSSKSCAGELTPLPGAALTVERGHESWTPATDAGGRYEQWLAGGPRRAEVTVTAEGHRPSAFEARLPSHGDVRRDVVLTRTDC